MDILQDGHWQHFCTWIADLEATREKREEAGFAGGGEHGERRRREPDSDAGRLRGSDLRRIRHVGRGT